MLLEEIIQFVGAAVGGEGAGRGLSRRRIGTLEGGGRGALLALVRKATGANTPSWATLGISGISGIQT